MDRSFHNCGPVWEISFCIVVKAAKAQHFAAKATAYAYYPFHYIGKREAEPTAAAEPKADAQYLYGLGYGYGGYARYGYGYPYYGYGYYG